MVTAATTMSCRHDGRYCDVEQQRHRRDHGQRVRVTDPLVGDARPTAGSIGGNLDWYVVTVASDATKTETHNKTVDTTNTKSHTETANTATLAAGVITYTKDTKGSAHTRRDVVTTKSSATTQVGGNATLTNTGIIGTLDFEEQHGQHRHGRPGRHRHGRQ